MPNENVGEPRQGAASTALSWRINPAVIGLEERVLADARLRTGVNDPPGDSNAADDAVSG